MLTTGIVSFASPWLLSAFVGLPIIWWLLRLLPPTPKRVVFAPIRLLLDLEPKEQTPAHTPWWLLVLRLLIVSLLILGLADPILNATKLLTDRNALVLVLDDGWPAAQYWKSRNTYLSNLLEEAVREDKLVILVRTSEPDLSLIPDGAEVGASDLIGPQPARQVKEQILALQPRSWLPDREKSGAVLRALKSRLEARAMESDVYWLADGLSYTGQSDFEDALSALGPVTIIMPDAGEEPIAMSPPRLVAEGFKVQLLRPDTGHLDARELRIRVVGQNSRLLGHANISFKNAETLVEGIVQIPFELRNLGRRLEVSHMNSAGSVILLDDRWQRRRVGIVTIGEGNEQPLLSDVYYIERALIPHAEILKGSVGALLEQNVTTLIFADVGQLIGSDKSLVTEWVQGGGTLIRFAGPRMASQSDDLLPVTLREGARALDGSLSWEEPQAITEFDGVSPFVGLSIPDDVTVKRQVLAQPSVELNQKTWARLVDGTPLVTGDSFGKGQRILFHVTANPDWSTLPLSGLFVDMLQRLVLDSRGVAQIVNNGEASAKDITAETYKNLTAEPSRDSNVSGQALLKPISILNGFGELEPAIGGLKMITFESLQTVIPSTATPPGYYGSSSQQFAVNTVDDEFEMNALKLSPLFGSQTSYHDDRALYLKPILLVVAFMLLLLDGIVALVLSGRLDLTQVRTGNPAVLIGLCFLSGVFFSEPATAQNSDEEAFALRATLETPMAYVITGNIEVDKMSHAGMRGLANALRQRTAMEPPLEPVGVRIESDELAFFPLLYWPVVSNFSDLDDETKEKIDAFLKQGGTILFDTQDYQSAVQGSVLSQGNQNLQQLLDGLDVPVLEPVPEDHVLTKSFYLLQDFPGRWSGGRLWVEARRRINNGATDGPSHSYDGVSSIIIGSNDYAAAWAEDASGRAMAATVPGGARQRELARRFGVNLVIYVLTGNYKADQVHVPALLERLGQ